MSSYDSLPPEGSHEFDNEDEIVRVLESGTEEEMERLKKHVEKRQGVPPTPEQMDLFRSLARQRRRLIDQSTEETRIREEQNPRATEVEYQAGVYRERLEAPVRDAVMMLREKGYASFESGFSGLEKQKISFDAPVSELEGFTLSEAARVAFETAGAEPVVHGDAIGFYVRKALSDEKMTTLWNLLVSELPILLEPQLPTSVGTAQGFRERQDIQFPR